ncbi:hypothetical protein Tco_0727349 [Tanacetum coccineum]|uniref:Reverse transcriptase domain-containing protein n=1 Tax=Tanacetum coccineum TaxID=301880 RepID=A0ABQ4YKD7_9ASTR
MSAMANTTPVVTTVTKTATKEKATKETDASLRVNILDFCEEHYEEILPVIMDKIRRDKRKEVYTRLDFRDNTKKSQRIREGSQNSSAGGTLTTENGPDRASSRDHSHSRGRPHRRDSSLSRDRPQNSSSEESYGNTGSSYKTGARHKYHSRDRDRPSIMKRGRESESPLSRVSEREPGMEDTGRQSQKGASLRMKTT